MLCSRFFSNLVFIILVRQKKLKIYLLQLGYHANERTTTKQNREEKECSYIVTSNSKSKSIVFFSFYFSIFSFLFAISLCSICDTAMGFKRIKAYFPLRSNIGIAAAQLHTVVKFVYMFAP